MDQHREESESERGVGVRGIGGAVVLERSWQVEAEQPKKRKKKKRWGVRGERGVCVVCGGYRNWEA